MKNAEIIEQLADCLAEDVSSDATSDLPDSLYSTKPWPEKTHRWCLAMMRAKFHGEWDAVQALQESGYAALSLAEKTLPKDPRGVLAAAWERHCEVLALREMGEGGPPAPPEPAPDGNPLHVDLDTGDSSDEEGGAA